MIIVIITTTKLLYIYYTNITSSQASAVASELSMTTVGSIGEIKVSVQDPEY
jgi:hypothetical protein